MSLFERLNDVEREVPLVMGILNVTPDSFSDGGKFVSKEATVLQVEKMLTSGVDIIDVGGESTRPGAQAVSIDKELQRVMPVIEWIREMSDVPVSVDTYKTAVMQEVLSLKVEMINDVNALQSDGALKLVSSSQALVCLMHKQGSFQDMQNKPVYDNVVEEVSQFLKQRILSCQEAGISVERILIDPGFGFGKTLNHNVELFKSLEKLVKLNKLVLVGVSRKSMIGLLQEGSLTENRMVGSVTVAVLAMLKGVSVLRVHDVKATVQALNVARKLI